MDKVTHQTDSVTTKTEEEGKNMVIVQEEIA